MQLRRWSRNFLGIYSLEMNLRIASVAGLTAALLATATYPQVALAAPTGSDQDVSTLNRHLATLVDVPGREHPAPAAAATSQAPAATPIPELGQKPTQAWQLTPAILAWATRYTHAERLLHFQSHGLDANLWGAFNGGRGVRIKYVIRF
jgi:hypothetical protein